MFHTHDFDEWLSLGNAPVSEKQVAGLMKATYGENAGGYKVTFGKVFRIKGPTGDSLLLATDKAREAFRRRVRSMHFGGEGDQSGSWRKAA